MRSECVCACVIKDGRMRVREKGGKKRDEGKGRWRYAKGERQKEADTLIPMKGGEER